MKSFFAVIAALFLSISLAFAAVNVNTASQQELQSLNGIGPVKAKAIVDYRTKNGPFKSIDDVDSVPGIGKGTMAKIRNDVSLTGNTTIAADAKSADKKVKDSKNTAKEAKPATKSAKDEKAGSTAGSASAKKEQDASSAGKDDNAKKASVGGDSRDVKGRFVKKDEKKTEGGK